MACGDFYTYKQKDTNPTYVPFWQPPGNPWWPTYVPTPVKFSYCPTCGVKLEPVMGFVCNRPECPVFAQITC